MKKQLILLCCLWFSICLNAQHNIDDFRSLKAQNPIPEYLKKLNSPTFEFDHKNKAQKSNDYMLKILLDEGSILFNDPISKHLNLVKTRFPKDFDQIQFLTVRSNVPAVFHNYDKYVFLTTGLISRLSNEAELIFFMGKGKDMLRRTPSEQNAKAYNFNTDLSKSFVPQFITDELIAEALIVQDEELNKRSNEKALDLLITLGLNPKASIEALTKLETGKFTFDSITINVEDLSISGISLAPEDLEEGFKAMSTKEYNRSTRSYHIGIQDQIKKLESALDSETESTNEVLSNKDAFEEIRTLSRFDLINHELHLGNIKRAIYYSLICKRSYPDNYFVNFSMARGFYALTAFANSKQWSKIKNKDRKIYGAYSKFNNFINNLQKEEINFLSLCLIHAIQAKFPDDDVLKQYRKDIEKDISKFTLLSKTNFDAKNKPLELKEELEVIDTINMSRAERIRAKQKLRDQNKRIANEKDGRYVSDKYLRQSFVSYFDSIDVAEIYKFLDGGEDFYYKSNEEVVQAELTDGLFINQRNNLNNSLLLNSSYGEYKLTNKKLKIDASISKSSHIHQIIREDDNLFNTKFLNPLYDESIEAYNQKGEFIRFISEINLTENKIRYKFSNQDIIDDLLVDYDFETISTLTYTNVKGLGFNELTDDHLKDIWILLIPTYFINIAENIFFQRAPTSVNCAIYDIEEGLLIQNYFTRKNIKASKILIESELYNLQSTLSNN